MPSGEIDGVGGEDGQPAKQVRDSCQAVAIVTARTPTNIAVIKYWGKRNEELILPLNSSVSVTLNPDDLAATTTVAVSESYERDRLWLNGKEVSVDGVRYQNCLREIRARAQDVVDEKTGKTITRADWQHLHVHIASVNNFPTAAGLASSAAGFACLVYALAKLMGVQETFPGELSAIARMGSGSACRSLYGGFVKWEMGCEEEGRDSVAVQLANCPHWSDLRVLIAVVSDRQKDTSSTSGMQQTVRTSPLLQHRVKEVVPQRIKAMEQAILAKNFEDFARLTMTDSNQFHATCLDTSPPIFYLNDTSRKLIAMVEKWNKFEGRPMAAYTFDAGPNAVLFTDAKNLPSLFRRLLYYFPPHPSSNADLNSFCADRGLLQQLGITSCEDIMQLQEPEEETTSVGGAENHGLRRSTAADTRRWPGELQYIISTTVGHGPRLLDSNAHALLDVHTGLPTVKHSPITCTT